MIDPRELIIVRSLYGDESLVTHKKVLWDIEHRTPNYSEKLGLNIHQRFIAFGTDNGCWLEETCDFELADLDVDVIKASPEPPPIYAAMMPLRASHETRKGGRVQQGVHHTWHKLEAIRIAMETEPRPKAVIYIDWDVIAVKPPDQQLVDMLNAGPVFQARLAYMPMTTIPWLRSDDPLQHNAYCGGCCYIRDQQFHRIIASNHATHFWADTEELATTRAVHNFPGHDGVDNPRLYVSACGMPTRGLSEEPYFRHGTVIHLKRFQQIMARDPWALGWLKKVGIDYP